MKLTLILCSLFCVSYVFGQNNGPLEPLLDTNPVSVFSESVKLYEIELDNIKIPISLQYDATGIKVNEIPGATGLSWKIINIGKISRVMNHLPDEYVLTANDSIEIHNRYNQTVIQGEYGNTNGWFFSKDNTPFSHIGTNFPNSVSAEFHNKYIDSSPDYFVINTANGINSVFFYAKRFNRTTLLAPEPKFLEAAQPITINTDFTKFNFNVNNYNDIVFDINDEDGNVYSFAGGPVKTSIMRSGYGYSSKHKDFYLTKISSSQNNDVITIEYEENLNTSYQTPLYAVTTPNISHGVFLGFNDSYADISTLEVNKIITPKEQIEFVYNDVQIGGQHGSSYNHQYVKQLDEMHVLDKEGNYVMGYKFNYITLSDGRFLLSKISKYDNHTHYLMLVKQFEYYPGEPNSFQSNDVDMFGYSIPVGTNPVYGIPNIIKFCGTYNGAPLSEAINAATKLPVLQGGVLKGMLKKSTNNLGGYTEYEYRLKSDNNYYGGGVVVSKIDVVSELNQQKTISFSYQNLKGYVLPLTGYKHYFIKSFPNFVYSFIFNDPVKYFDTDPLDADPELGYQFFTTQMRGNYFQKVTTVTYLTQNLEGEEAIIKENEYLPSYTGIQRNPLLFKQSLKKEYLYQGQITISEKEQTYTRSKIGTVMSADAKYEFLQYYCFPADNGGLASFASFHRKPLYIIRETVDKISSKEYLYDDSTTNVDVVQTDTYINYVGQNFKRPKQIMTTKNGQLTTRKRYKYLFEIFPGSGLSGLSSFGTQDRTLIIEESDWVYSAGNIWTLKEAEHYMFYNDVKLKRYMKTRKNHNNNTFYTDLNYTPVYGNNFSGVSTEEQLEFTYNSNGKLTLITDSENGKYRMFSREHDRNPYDVNTVLEGNLHLIDDDTFYRNSFENETTNVTLTSIAYTGNKVFSGTSLNLGFYPEGYIVSFWCYRNNRWEFNSSIHQGGTLIVNRPNDVLYIDELWVRPAHTELNGCTYLPLIGKSSTIDNRGQVVKTVYDNYGRDIKQLDKDNNILQEKNYNLIND